MTQDSRVDMVGYSTEAGMRAAHPRFGKRYADVVTAVNEAVKRGGRQVIAVVIGAAGAYVVEAPGQENDKWTVAKFESAPEFARTARNKGYAALPRLREDLTMNYGQGERVIYDAARNVTTYLPGPYVEPTPAAVFAGYTVMLIVVLVCLAVYMLPTIIAFYRNLSGRWSIAIANLFLGVTLFAWVLCLMWSVGGESRPRYFRHFRP